MGGVDVDGVAVLRKQLRRSQVLSFFSRLPRCVVGRRVRPPTIGRGSSTRSGTRCG
jgi:hypothetical protein